MKHKVAELEGALLDVAVAVALGYRGPAYVPEELCGTWYAGQMDGGVNPWEPSASWFQAGPIIERERIGMEQGGEDGDMRCFAWRLGQNSLGQYGPTPLIATMRAYVASKVGDEIDLP